MHVRKHPFNYHLYFITFAASKSKEHILLTLTALQHPRNGDRKSMHSFSTTSLKDKEDTIQPVQMIIFQYNNYNKDLHWLHFIDEPRVHKQQVFNQQPCILLFVAYPTYPSSNFEYQSRHNNSIQCKVGWYISN